MEPDVEEDKQHRASTPDHIVIDLLIKYLLIVGSCKHIPLQVWVWIEPFFGLFHQFVLYACLKCLDDVILCHSIIIDVVVSQILYFG